MSSAVPVAEPPPSTPDKSAERIARMFDAIAPRYDFLNHLLSAGIDRRWRSKAIASLELTGREVLLDVCAGTADMALEAHATRGAARVVGVDFSAAMLSHGLRKVETAGAGRHVSLLRGDAMALPVRTAAADAATVAFGIRNVERAGVALAEIARALKTGGRLAILEFGVPTWPGVRTLYLWYFRHVLPRVGRVVSRHSGAYSYLPASVGVFPPPDEFVAELQLNGFERVRARPLTGGIAYLYTGVRR